MLNLGIPFEFGAMSGSGGGSKWYAPIAGKPTVLPVVSGTDALAAGNRSQATGNYGVAMGYWCVAGSNSLALGQLCSAGAGANMAVGYNNIAGNNYDVSVGFSNQINFSGGVNTYIGYQNGNAGLNAFLGVAIGAQNTAGQYGVGLGYANQGWGGIGSVAIGCNNSSYVANAICLGYGARAIAYGNGINGQAQRHSFNRASTNTLLDTFTGRHSSVLFGDAVTENLAVPVQVNAQNPLWLPVLNSVSIEGHMVVRRTSDGASAKWKITGLAKRSAGTVYNIVGMTLGIAGAPDFADAGAAGWVATAAAVARPLPETSDSIEFYVNFNSATNTETFIVAGELSLVYYEN